MLLPQMISSYTPPVNACVADEYTTEPPPPPQLGATACARSPLRAIRSGQSPNSPESDAWLTPVLSDITNSYSGAYDVVERVTSAIALLSDITRMARSESAVTVSNDRTPSTGWAADDRLTTAAWAGDERPTINESPPGERSKATGAPLTTIGV